MEIVKIFNNNVVSTITSDQKEAIVLGNGVGFRKKVGDPILKSCIEKIFFVQSEQQTKFLELISKTDVVYFEIAEEIIQRANISLQKHIDQKYSIALGDHIAFAIEREKQNISLPNLLKDEIKILYTDEFNIGVWALEKIKEKCDITLQEDEAAYIGLHILNASMEETKDRTMKIIQFSNGVLEIVKGVYTKDFQIDDLNFIRFKSHLKYLAKRVFQQNETVESDVADLYEFLMQKSGNKRCVDLINSYVKNEFEYDLSKAEIVYLLVHINKLFHSKEKGEKI